MLTLSLTVELIASNAQALETSEGSDSSMNCLIFLPTLIPGTALMAVFYPFMEPTKLSIQ